MSLMGLSSGEIGERRAKYGTNSLTQLERDSLSKKILYGFKDPMIMILLVALIIQGVLYFMGQAQWFEPVGILVAVLIANGVASVSEYRQEGKAVALRNDEAAKDMTKVLRDGELSEIPVGEVVQGDIIFLQAGDRLPTDGVFLEGTVHVDQSVLNGETEEIYKYPVEEGSEEQIDVDDLLNPHYAYRGTVVCSGEGYLETRVVGDNTLFGQLALEAQSVARRTPLQVKLDKLARHISTFGYVGAIAIVAGILMKTAMTGAAPESIWEWVRLIIDAVTVAVTVIVCAVPEGLPMLTSMLLSVQSLKMEKDNVLVKKINGIETSGSLSILFSDKTGTITEGKLSVMDITLGDLSNLRKIGQLELKTKGGPEASPAYLEKFLNAAGLNNSAHAGNGSIIGGNSTDRSIIKALMKADLVDKIHREAALGFKYFNSRDKYSAVAVDEHNECRCYLKGAPEVLVSRCSHYLSADGSVHVLASHDALLQYLDDQARRSMRLLALAYGPGSVTEQGEAEAMGQLVLVGIICIRDNLRPEAVGAIREVQNAGVQVVMITGDKRETAVAIAKESGLLHSREDVVLTSNEMKKMSDDEVKHILPKLRVVARALPTDKSRLVHIAQELDMVVGMTGDGVNDAPALKKAEVGFAMGSGTEVAKEAGDITILDDNFQSVVKAILYGRSIFKSIRKFLIFQLTVNVAAVLVCFLAPMLGENIVLTVIQLLLINLAMDTLAAVAYGSEPALEEYMLEKPVARQESIVTRRMLVQVIINALVITIICLSILFLEPVRSLFGDVTTTYLKSALFATFMMAITFNGFNARTEHLNVFEHLGRNNTFLLVSFAIFAMQWLFVEFGGEILSVEPLSLKTWLICAAMAILVIPVDVIRRIIMR
ncbi:calcium-translocating P-type ATPase, PMCA-type [uncultured Anaerovibrio sp.]|uniref:calcium-translocating P-type ATPase, PMCA-type n=1 Tax=uncultured Anaerovibrio sp. TaxID=361586 RepID=UPI002635DB59|nr:calcium-translocating P-type ATPase, PMCA-type [uncultured Anaerovibrio sp.]